MRELKRSIARSLMENAGVAHINRKTIEHKDKKGKVIGRRSYFAVHWREYIGHHVDPDRNKDVGNAARPISKQFMSRLLRRIRKNGNNN